MIETMARAIIDLKKKTPAETASCYLQKCASFSTASSIVPFFTGNYQYPKRMDPQLGVLQGGISIDWDVQVSSDFQKIRPAMETPKSAKNF